MMNGNAMRIWIVVLLVMLGVAGGAQAMGDKLPTEPAQRWERPGDAIARKEPAIPDAQEQAADGPQIFLPAEGEPRDWEWKARLVVVFADAPGNPSFIRQMRALESGVTQLVERDVVVITDTDPAAASAWRRTLRPEGFSLVLIDLDGTVMLRKPVPWDIREISRAIDRFPLRRQELRRGPDRP